MKGKYNTLCISLFILITMSVNSVYSQSAIGQLESMTGTKISSGSVPAVSAPSLSNVVAGTIMQGLINNLFAPTTNPAADKAKQEAELKAAQEAAAMKAAAEEAARKAEQAAHDKYEKSKLTLPGFSGEVQPLSLPANTSTNFFGTGNSNVPSVDLSNVNDIGTIQSLKTESTYHIKLESEVPPLPGGMREIKNSADNYTAKVIDGTRSALVDVVSLLPPGLNYASIAAVDALGADALLIHGCFFLNPPNCPSTGKILGKITENILIDVGSAAAGDLGGKYVGKATKLFDYTRSLEKTTAKEIVVGTINDFNKYKSWNLDKSLTMINNKVSSADDIFLSTTGSIANKGVDMGKIALDTEEKPYNVWDW